MRRMIIMLLIMALPWGCSRWDMIRMARIAATRDVSSARRMGAEKAIKYAANPKALERDIRRFRRDFAKLMSALRQEAGAVWGDKDLKEPGPKEYVKYTQNYLSRASVDFDRGIVTVETLAQDHTIESLTNAVITTLLTPEDPRAVDIFSSKTVRLGEMPFLYGEVKDHEGKNIRWSWRAERFAKFLIEKRLQKRQIEAHKKARTVHYVTIPMVPDHHQVRASKYRGLVERFAGRYGLSKNLVYAIIKTESDFNPHAVSPAPAFGLMQIVPHTAGQDVYRFLNNREGIPSKEFLFNPRNNILYGTAYLHLLNYEYLDQIRNPVSRQYCVIAAYNAGAGNVLMAFDNDRAQAPQKINALHPSQVFKTLRTKLPGEEARLYLVKVTEAQKQFVNF